MESRLMHSDAVPLLKALVACPSITPESAGALDLLDGALTSLGFKVERLRFEGDGSYPVDNLFASFGGSGRHLLFAGHTDVVPPGDLGAWSHPPFAAETADGCVYGRGTADMKSGIAAFIAAVSQAISAGETGDGRLSLAITNDEEADAINGTEKLLAWAAAQGYHFDFAVVGEPSSAARVGDSIKIGRRGSLNAEIVVNGVQGHVAYPDKALNPLPLLARLVSELSGRLDDGNAAFPPSNLEFTSIDVGNPVSNVIPGKAVARLNVRYNDQWTPDSLTRHLGQRVEKIVGSNAQLRVLGRPSRSFLSPTGGGVSLLVETIAASTGTAPELSTGGGTSDARFIAAYCPVVELGIVGPTMHKVDEHVAVSDVEALTVLYRRFIAAYLH
jgi:succinyl-diaminopimelate desuccinylase